MYTLQELQFLFGTPIEINSVALDELQATFLARSICRLVNDAKHSFDVAVDLGVEAFRNSYELVDSKWVQRKHIFLPNCGKTIRHCLSEE